MNDLMKMDAIVKMGKTTGLYLDHLNEQLDQVEDDNADCPLNAHALVKTLEMITQLSLVQSLEINQLNEKVEKLTEIHQSHFDIQREIMNNKNIVKLNQLLKDVDREQSSVKRQEMIVKMIKLLVEIQ